MNVLVLCEESQVVCKAFRAKGHNAFSADLQKCSGGCPQWHIVGDGLKLLYSPKVYGDDFFNIPKEVGFEFYTQNGDYHFIEKWDLLIAHPPCTFLAASGACNLFNKDHTIKDFQRWQNLLDARAFFMKIYNCNVDKICIENPRPLKAAELPKETIKIQPWQFGDYYTKYTYLWLKNLPPLMPLFTGTDEKPPSWCKVHSSAKKRSKTFQGIADAMAFWWG